MFNCSNNGVYCLTSPCGKRYVGIAIRKDGIEGRWKEYRRLHCKEQPKLYNALKKYGPENFKYEVMLETDDVDNAKRSEMYLIDVWNLQDDNYGYNITAGGDHNISDAFRYSQKGKIKSNETKEKMSLAKIGKKMTKDFCDKVSSGKKGKIKYENNKLSKVITIKNKYTGEERTGLIQTLFKELSINNTIYKKYGHRGWKITNKDNV